MVRSLKFQIASIAIALTVAVTMAAGIGSGVASAKYLDKSSPVLQQYIPPTTPEPTSPITGK